jgi:exodeoxyribonuclease V beta subunit
MTGSFQVIHGAADIDLTHHAVIEASAGTGKTYTMVALVMRLMADEQAGLPLDKILITTFTDNAANELKSRIRKQLKQQLSEGGLSEKITRRFEKGLQQIESAPIHTIHGFCQRMTREFAFESGQIFDQELVDDKRVLEDCFNAYVRTWPADETIKAEFNAYLAADAKNSLAKLKTTVLTLASQIKPDFDVIYPQDPKPLTDLGGYKLMAGMDSLKDQFMQLYTNKGGTINKFISNNWSERVEPLLTQLSDPTSTHQQKLVRLNRVIDRMGDIDCFAYFFKSAPKAFKDGQWALNKEKYATICQQLEAVFELINQLKSHRFFRQAAIIKRCLDHLNTAVSDYLSEQGQVTYDRIIRQLYEILQREKSDNSLKLSDAIRNQFSVAMIDEFQDTDPYQWHIFKWLFLSTNNSTHRLWVIGDPKQSIYGFRGADVNTYYHARSSLQAVGANSYRLNTNYRSITPLISTFNYFFTAQQDVDSPGYWYPKDSIEVAAADRQDNPELPQLQHDNSGLSAFNYMPLDGDNNAELRRLELAELIADIIKTRLIGRLEFTFDNKAKILNYDDICILVRAHSDSDVIKKVCQDQQIPISLQKSKGLYLQPEAIQYEVILSALHQPHDNARVHNALSTLFFDQTHSEQQLLSDQQQRTLNQQWLQLLSWAKSAQWVALFDWLVDGSGARFRAEKSHNRRQLANLQKIANTLCRYAIQNNASRAELLRYYKKLRLTAAEQEEDDQNQDTDQQAVKVMTQHGAKGLEFPVVFIFDGLTNTSDKDAFHKYYSESEQATVYDISKQSKKSQNATKHKEFKQLYYVAITRAVYKIFVPYLDADSKSLSDNYRQLMIDNINRCLEKSDNQDCCLINTASAQPPGPSLSKSKEPAVSLTAFSQGPTQLSKRSQFIHSFSSLSQYVISDSSDSEQRHFGDESTISDELSTADLVQADVPLIPGGVTTGHVLHGVFENVNFNAVMTHNTLDDLWQDSSIMSVIDEQMQLFKMANQPIHRVNLERTEAKDYQQQMAVWVWHTLKKPLPILAGQSLGMIGAQDRRHEMAFHWQHQGQTLTGYIDLLFRVDDGQGGHNYYILDWKSNLNAEGYAPDVLAKTVMKNHHYDLQYQIYAAAVSSWFQQLNLPNARLKGAIYAFSRGINWQSDDLLGFYCHKFTDLAQQNKETQQHIATLTGAKP